MSGLKVLYIPTKWLRFTLYTSVFSAIIGCGGVPENVVTSDNGIDTPDLVLPNSAPTARDDELRVLADQDALNVAVLDNDFDPDGDELRVISVDASAGEVDLNQDGTINFRPPANFEGEITVSYVISDGEYESVATVLVTVTDVSNALYNVDISFLLPEYRDDGEHFLYDDIAAFEVAYRKSQEEEYTIVRVDISKVDISLDTATIELEAISAGDYEFKVAVIETDGVLSHYSDTYETAVM